MDRDWLQLGPRELCGLLGGGGSVLWPWKRETWLALSSPVWPKPATAVATSVVVCRSVLVAVYWAGH